MTLFPRLLNMNDSAEVVYLTQECDKYARQKR
jgi:hypothetical protein